MRKAPPPPTREERLAARLRDNLHRRKAQARAMDAAPAENAGACAGESGAPLSKSPPSG